MKYFHFEKFLLNASRAAQWLIDLEKVRTDYLKFRTDLQDRVMGGWSVTQYIIVYKGRLLKKSSNRKLKLVLSALVTKDALSSDRSSI